MNRESVGPEPCVLDPKICPQFTECKQLTCRPLTLSLLNSQCSQLVEDRLPNRNRWFIGIYRALKVNANRDNVNFYFGSTFSIRSDNLTLDDRSST